MKNIDLTKTITEVDGVTPYSFGSGRTIRGEDGQPVEVRETATFQKLLNSALRQGRVRQEREETQEQYDARVLASLAFTEKVFNASAKTEFSNEEIDMMKGAIAGTPTVVYGQFLRMCE